MKKPNAEFYLLCAFHLSVALYLIPVLMPEAFVTHDGPTHLYNAHILKSLLFNESGIYHSYHEVNPHWFQPNLLGYGILMLFQSFLPFLWAEKLTVALYLVGLAYGFRYLLLQLSKEPGWALLLFLPFLYNSILFWGFYNFLLGLTLLFFLLGYSEKHRQNGGWQTSAVLMLLSLLVWFSHPLVFLFGGMYLFIRSAWSFPGIEKARQWFWQEWKRVWFMLPGTVLLIFYLFGQEDSEAGTGIGTPLLNRLDDLFWRIECLSFGGYSEGTYLWIIHGVILWLLVLKFRNWFRSGRPKPGYLTYVVLLFLLGLLFLPDSASGGSVILVRLNLLLYLFVLVWMSTSSPGRLSKYLILLAWLAGFPLLYQRWQLIQSNALQYQTMKEICLDHIPPASVIGSVHLSPLYRIHGRYQSHSYIDFFGNMENYLAIEKNALSLNNYEANTQLSRSYFPIVWQRKDASLEQSIYIRESGRTLHHFNYEVWEQLWGSFPHSILAIGTYSSDLSIQDLWDDGCLYRLQSGDELGLIRLYRLNRVTP